MVNALHFNALRDTEPRFIKSDFSAVDEFYVRTNVGPLMAAEVWKDTVGNRDLIAEISLKNKEKAAFIANTDKRIYALLNAKEK